MKLYGNNSGSHSSSGKDREIKVQEIRVPEKESAAKAPAKKKKKKRGRRRALIVICAIVLAICAALAVYAIWERPPEVAAPPAANSNSSTVPNAPSNGDTPDNSGAAPEDDLEVLAPEIAFDSEHAEGVYTMLVVGRDYASNSTDAIMLARFDTVAHKIDVVNIPRDTMVNISWATTPKKINAVSSQRCQSPESSDGITASATAHTTTKGVYQCANFVTTVSVRDLTSADPSTSSRIE